ncbi:MAG: DUF5674 family protein [bacterium]|nr:DUF5674 family protein [bacterium]
MEIRIIEKPISRDELRSLAQEGFGEMVKVVVDIEKGIMAAGGELHADEEAVLLEGGSEPNNLWGINLYPGIPDDTWLEFNSMINIRPSQNNRSRSVENEETQAQIKGIVDRLVTAKE